MNKVLAVLKVNLLSLIAIPFFLVSVVFNFIAAVLQQAVILSVGVIILSYLAIILMFTDGITAELAVVFVFFGGLVIIGLLLAVVKFISSLIGIVANMAGSLVEGISIAFAGIYMSLYDNAETTMEITKIEEITDKGFDIACFMYYIMYGIQFVVLLIIKSATAISALGVIAGGILCYVKANSIVQHDFNMSVFKFVGLFGTWDIIFYGAITLVVLGTIAVTIMAIGAKWSSMEGAFMGQTGIGEIEFQAQAEQINSEFGEL